MRVFVSCAPADRALAEQVSRELSRAGHSVWFDGDISGAEQWWRRCIDGVRDADVFLTVWTNNLAAARPATALLQHAGALGRPVLAVRSGQVDRPDLGPTVTILEFGDGALGPTVQAMAQQTGPWPNTQAPPPPWPFAYLYSLREFVAAPVLPAHDQQQLLARLRAASDEDGQYPAVRDEVTAVAAGLRNRPDLDPALRPQLDALAPPPEQVAPQQYWSPAPQPPTQYFAPQGFAPQGHPGYPGYAPQGFPGYPPPPTRSTSGRTLAIIGAVAVVVIIALVAGIVLLTRSDDGSAGSSDASGSGTSEPDTDDPAVQLLADGISVGSRVAPVTIDVFNDALCPACGRFISLYGDDIRSAVLDNEIQVHYHVVAILDDYSASGDYSSRAAAAVYCVAQDGDVDTFENFYSALFDPVFQPEEGGTSDHTDDDLADLATESGAPASAAECITSGTDASAAARRTAAALTTFEGLGGEGVPAVYDDGVEVDVQPGWVDALTR
ncbi:TIR domain-containing protein [Mycolicibacterium arseniciresistens]|uniref:TIR domain-containing protein n=1 Tax=Mycolicibacterium arseniciresistens TaxID=3062257 RepID=A0ABT8UM88_9MYCO|nr:TIR domain-containing protein [Mycolicibacterium arseniciresistens]MDO3638928.1 TIR domain-containing protein [Mycolicibacterium arseniciresistens]